MVSKIRSRKNLKKELLDRSQESYDKKDESGRFGSFFKSKSELGDKEFWKCNEGEHQIDIIPFIVGSQFPTKNYPNIKAGDIAYWLDLWAHYNVGPNEDAVVCPTRNYGKPCPICEHVNQLRKEEDPDDDIIKEKLPRRRSIYQIVCYDSDDEEKKGVQIWDVAHWFMEKHLSELAQKPKRGGFIPFADPDDGKQIFFKRKGTGQFNTEYIAHQFLDRDYTIEDSTLDDALALDEAIIVLTYDEIKSKYWGEEEVQAEGPDDEPAPSKRARKPAPVQEEDPKEHAGPDEENGSKEPEDETPQPRRRVRKKAEEPAKEEKKKEGECPAGGQFGVDLDKPLPECDNCDVWDDCAAKANEIEADQKKR